MIGSLVWLNLCRNVLFSHHHGQAYFWTALSAAGYRQLHMRNKFSGLILFSYCYLIYFYLFIFYCRYMKTPISESNSSRYFSLNTEECSLSWYFSEMACMNWFICKVLRDYVATYTLHFQMNSLKLAFCLIKGYEMSQVEK